MRITYLNSENGSQEAALTKFLMDQVQGGTDVFCFQEAYAEMRSIAGSILTDFVELYDYKYVTDDDNFPMATYVAPHIEIRDSGTVLKATPGTGLALYTSCGIGEEEITICNFHGMSRPIDKLDSRGRDNQTRELISFAEGAGPIVIGGDFNMFPDTDSIRQFTSEGFEDLIAVYGIINTRNELAWNRHPGSPQFYSDYVFSRACTVSGFVVPYLLVSDHLPLTVDASS
jgi:endonuclease/exonuclease/phosphatase (EEP) superfamily protein YafD